LTASSEYFQNALKKNSAGEHADVITLEDVDPAVFGVYVQWLYMGELFCIKSSKTPTELSNHILLGELYGLGERLLDRELQNRVIDALLAGTRELQDGTRRFPTACVPTIYKSTPPGSPARRLMIDFFVRFGGAFWVQGLNFELMDSETQFEFLKDLSESLLENRQMPTSGMADYHELDSGIPSSYYHSTTQDTENEAEAEGEAQG
jgi:hypothetical protein